MLHKGSDLHLKAGLPGMMRLRGVIQKMNTPVLTQETMEKLIYPILREKDKKVLEDTGGADFAHVIGNDEARYRVNLLKQRGKFAMVARLVNQNIPTFEKLGLPPTIEKLCHYEQGMVLLAGVTGSGKIDDHRVDARLHERRTRRCTSSPSRTRSSSCSPTRCRS